LNMTVKEYLKNLGWGIALIGLMIGLILGSTMKIYYPGLEEQLHPLRWIYGLSTIFSTLFFGSVLIGISEIINKLELHKNEKQTPSN
jgi:hypothetical protein